MLLPDLLQAAQRQEQSFPPTPTEETAGLSAQPQEKTNQKLIIFKRAQQNPECLQCVIHTLRGGEGDIKPIHAHKLQSAAETPEETLTEAG